LVKVSIVIPTMNEEASVGKVIESVHTAFHGTRYEHEVLIIDTNSKDRTREISIEKGARVVEEPRRGYGRAYKTGFDAADGEIIATLDADCTYPAGDIPKLLDLLQTDDLDFITTDRFADMEPGAMSGMLRFGNWVLNSTTRVLFRVKFRDSQSGMWIFRKKAYARLVLIDDGMPFSEEIKIEAFRKLKAREVPIRYMRRVGEVKLSSWRDGWRNFKFLWRKRLTHPR
jgi:dolichol-phosphate hexosyltransferase